MSHHDYLMSRQVQLVDGVTFYGVIMAAMRMADTENLEKLRAAFPASWDELYERYHAPQGVIPSDPEAQRSDFERLFPGQRMPLVAEGGYVEIEVGGVGLDFDQNGMLRRPSL